MNPTPTPDPLGRKIDGRAALTQALEKLDSPTPNSPAPVDIARLRELLEKATPGPWKAWRRHLNGERDSARLAAPTHRQLGFINSSDDDADFIAALRNDAPALLNELESRREESEWIEQIETLLFIATPDEKGLPAPLDDLSLRIRMVIAERDKLCEEVERTNGIMDDLAKANIEARKERDSLRQQNERLLAEIEKLKSISRSRNWKESQ